ncbi:hypothetical protein BKA69DRAFT_399408 [Paraphysoderma sedebokerense]|nr:hypothetical protein BKA69DRAFT_399408 [Paraphysoderma sedebokerense]
MNYNSFKIVEDYSSNFYPGGHHSRENLKVSPNKLVLDPISNGDSVSASLNLEAQEASFGIEDNFFITGTNLEETSSLPDLNDQLEALDLDAYFSQYFIWNPVNRGYNHFFPKSIQDSVRLLRQALANPVFYWRIVDKTYTQHTFATRQKTLRCNDRVQKDIRRNHFRSNSSSLYFVYAKSVSNVTSKKTALAFNSGLGQLDNSSRNFNSLDCVDIQATKTLGKHPSMNLLEDQSHRVNQKYERDGVSDLQQMMNQVVIKLQTLEQKIRYHRWNI